MLVLAPRGPMLVLAPWEPNVCSNSDRNNIPSPFRGKPAIANQ